MADAIAQYLDDDGTPITADVKLPKGYSLLSSKTPATPKKKVSDLKAQAEKLKPVDLPKTPIRDSVSAYQPSILEQVRNSVANSAIGYSLEQALPKVATALHLHPSEKQGTPQAEQHRDQLLSPEYLAPALTESIRTGPLMMAPAPPEGRAPDATSNRIEGALRASGDLTSAKNMSIMAGTGVAAALTAGIVNPATTQVLSRLVSGGFTLDMLHGLYQQHKEYRKAVDAGDVNEAQKIQGEMGVTGIMALLTGKHALTKHPFTPVKDIPTRDRTNVLHRNTAGEVRQAKGQAPSVWLSPKAWESFMGSFAPGEDAAATHGVNLPANGDLHSFAHDANLTAANPSFGDVQQLLAKAHENASGGGVAIANTRPSIQSNVNVMREELNHTWQRSLSENGRFHNHLKPEAFADLHQAIPKGMQEHLLDQGYDGESHPEMVTETAAKLMDGRPERFGVSPDEAVDFLDKYFKHVSEQHGTKALEELHHVRGIAADAKTRAIGEHSRTGAGQDNGTVSGVANGGQGGVGQGVPAPTDPAFNRDKDKPTWYLKSERLIGDKIKGPQAAEDIHKMLLSGGVKPEEMQWTGLDDFLKSKGNGKVTPDEIREHLANNNIQIKEVMKPEARPVEWKSYGPAMGAAMYTPDGYMIERLVTNGRYLLNTPAGMAKSFETEAEAKAEVDKYRSNTGSDTIPTKYSQYQLPGGENYREMLLTIPEQERPEVRALREYRNVLLKKYDVPFLTEQNLQRLSPEERAEEERLFDAVDHGRPASESRFKSSHWDEPNILAHTRFNDRTGPSGEKLLHVEELQSDWHQKGRDKGYAGGETPELIKARKHLTELQEKTLEAKKAMKDAYDKMVSLEANVSSLEYKNAVSEYHDRKQDHVSTREQREDAGYALRDLEGKDKNKVPDAPFKKTWHEMALRRVLKHASENGYDGVSWTGGEDQAARYDLSKQIKGLRYSDDGVLTVYGMDGNEVMRKQVPVEQLPDTIGKEAAKKLVEQEPSLRGGDKVLDGLDLKIGGEGMKGFYDKIVPDYLNKFGKKFGAKVGTTEINTGKPAVGDGWEQQDMWTTLENDGRRGNMPLYAIFDSGGNWVGTTGEDLEHFDGAEGEKLIKVADEDGKLLKDAKLPGTSKTVQHLPITPEMRQSVTEEGMPLFNREQVKTPEFKKWFGDSKVVDEKGEPQILYHATTKDFKSFNPSKGELGNHFGTSDHSNAAVGNYSQGVRNIPVYLSIKNPLRLNDLGDFYPSSVAPQLVDKGLMTEDEGDNIIFGNIPREKMASLVRDAIKKGGYDGVVYLNRREGLPEEAQEDRVDNLSEEEFKKAYPDAKDSWISFDAKQVKSALGNSGAFDPKDSNILRNRERRVDDATRKRVEDMSPEEMRKALLTSDKTGIPNRRAFDDAEHVSPSPAVAMSDADGLKALNDRFGYAAGDELLKAKADALKAAGLDAYHEKGDEFLYRGASPEKLKEKLDKARELLRDRTIEVTLKDGKKLYFKGADFSYGTGKDLDESESGLKQHKSEREASGERVRGELRGITEVEPGKGGEHSGDAEVGDPLDPNILRNREKPNYGGYARHTEQVPVAALDKYKEADRTLEPKGDIEALKEDIKKNGIKEPLILNYDPDSGKAGLGEGNTRLQAAKELGLKTVPVRVRRSNGRGGVAEVGAYSGPETDFHGNPRVPGDLSPSHIGIETVPEDDNPSSDQDKTDLDVNTNSEGDAGKSPEHPMGEDVSPPAVSIQIQGGTQLASAPVQEPAVPVPTKPVAKVLPLSHLKVLAAGLMPNSKQPTVNSVRELMKEAAKRNTTAMIP